VAIAVFADPVEAASLRRADLIFGTRISSLMLSAQGQHSDRLKNVQKCSGLVGRGIGGPCAKNFCNNANINAATSMACGLQFRRNGNRPGPTVGVKQR